MKRANTSTSTSTRTPSRRLACLLGAVAGAVTLLMAATSCGAKPPALDRGLEGLLVGAVDAAGMTKQQATELPLHTHFALVSERDHRMGELFAEAQAQLAEQPWTWGQFGVIPVRGPNAWSARGMSLDNSYHLSMWAWTQPEGAHGDRSDLEPMLRYFERNGWPHEIRSEGSHRHRVVADTNEGFIVRWRIQPSGTYTLELFSKSYWGASRELQRAIAYRIPAGGLRTDPSKPDERPSFPDWADPEDSTLNFGGPQVSP